MSTNRPKSKTPLFRAAKVDPIQTENINDISSFKSDNQIAADESNETANKVIQAVVDSAKHPAQLLVNYLNKTDMKNRADNVISLSNLIPSTRVASSWL
jgi:hypothetical protein